ncbi:MAG: phosphoglycerate kinase, partial [Bacteroidota bacterium]
MKTVDNFNFSNKRVLIRVDFNVPMDAQFNVTDDTRIRAAIPTIKKILADGGSVVLMSHLGRPKKGADDKYSLKHIVKQIETLLGRSILFADDCIGESAKKISTNLKSGEVL